MPFNFGIADINVMSVIFLFRQYTSSWKYSQEASVSLVQTRSISKNCKFIISNRYCVTDEASCIVDIGVNRRSLFIFYTHPIYRLLEQTFVLCSSLFYIIIF